jgi:hypothetical protein
MALEVYWASGSPFAWRVLLTLEAKRLPYQSKLLTFSKGEHKSPEYLAMNPRGKVPTLKDGDFAIYESLAIMAYLDRAYPDQSSISSILWRGFGIRDLGFCRGPQQRGRTLVVRLALMPSAKGSAVETFSLDTALGELLSDPLNVLYANCEVAFATRPVNEEVNDNVGFVGWHRKLSQTFPDTSGIYARKISDRLELTVRFIPIAYAAKMDAILGRMVHLKTISHTFSPCRGRP